MKLLPGFYQAALIRAVLLILIGAFLGFLVGSFVPSVSPSNAMSVGIALFTIFAMTSTASRAKKRYAEVGHLPTSSAEEVARREALVASKVRMHR